MLLNLIDTKREIQMPVIEVFPSEKGNNTVRIMCPDSYTFHLEPQLPCVTVFSGKQVHDT